VNRRQFLSTLAGAPALVGQLRRPNVLLILADDLGWGDLSVNGCPDIRTPHIDALARQGMRFSQSYANAPECTPTRCALLTGRYQHRVGGLECAIGVNNIGRYDEAAWLQERGELGLPASERTLGQLFREAGYDTACFGKWHLGYLDKFWPDKHGFAKFFGILGGNADYFTHEEQGEGLGKTQLYEDGRKVDRSGYLTDLFADAVIDWLKLRRTAPFFLYLPFTAPHTPIQAAEDFDAKTGTAPHRNLHRPTYCKMVQHMDRRIGDVLEQLERTGAAENTIVVFASDNGADPNGRNAPYRGRKSSLWEGGIRVPLHVRWPGRIREGSETPQVALTMDLAPTLLRAAGVMPRRPPRFDGDDLLPILTGARQPYERTVFWRYRRGSVTRKAVRQGNWKYVYDAGTEELHDLSRDPQERRNVIKENAGIAAGMRAKLASWEQSVRADRLKEFKPQRQ